MKAVNGMAVVAAVALSLISNGVLAAHGNKHVRKIVRQEIAKAEAAEAPERFAYVSSAGTLDVARSSGMTQANITMPFGDIGIYCFVGLSPVANIQATIDIADADDLAVPYGILEYAPECPVLVAHIDQTGGGLVKAGFFVTLQ